MPPCGRCERRRGTALYAAYCGATAEELSRLLELAKNIDDRYWLHARGERLPDELRSLIALENTARLIAYYEPIVIPGLVQTEDYARALFYEGDLIPEDGIEPRVRVRMERQRLLRRRHAPKTRFFLHENALRMPVGGNRIMHEQVMHLMMCFTDSCMIRVVPATIGAQAGATGPFIWMAHPDHNPVVYTEHVTTSLFLEGRDDIRHYRRLLERLTVMALDEGQSSEFLASLASEYDREGGHDLAEEQL